jgi:hypothetical protein
MAAASSIVVENQPVDAWHKTVRLTEDLLTRNSSLSSSRQGDIMTLQPQFQIAKFSGRFWVQKIRHCDSSECNNLPVLFGLQGCSAWVNADWSFI